MNRNQPTTSVNKLSSRNQVIYKTYFAILKAAKALLAPIEEEPLRYSLIREDKLPIVKGTIVHEIVTCVLILMIDPKKPLAKSSVYQFTEKST